MRRVTWAVAVLAALVLASCAEPGEPMTGGADDTHAEWEWCVAHGITTAKGCLKVQDYD